MRALLQRVSKADLVADGNPRGHMNHGLVILLGIEEADTPEDLDWLCRKILGMRIFNDTEGQMNLSVQDVQGSLMVVSQFTLHASTKKGNRPSFIRAATPEIAKPLYASFIDGLTLSGLPVITGIFGADMQVRLVNDGPVSIWIDSKNRE